MAWRLAMVLLVLALAVPQMGCPIAAVAARMAMPDTTTIKAEYSIGQQTIVIVPFRDAGKMYFESNDGLDIATALEGEIVSRKAAVNVRSAGPIAQKFGGQDLGTVGWAEVGKSVGADLVMVGDVQEFRLKDPGAVNIYHGYSRVAVRVINVKTGCVVYASPAIETWCPDFGTATYAPGIPAADTTPERMRRGLISATALKVGQRFYTWEKPVGGQPSTLMN